MEETDALKASTPNPEPRPAMGLAESPASGPSPANPAHGAPGLPAPAEKGPAAETVPSRPGKIGLLHANIRRAKARPALDRDVESLYRTYGQAKSQLAAELGLGWSFDLSYVPQWGGPDGGSAAAQWLTTSSLDWTLLKSKALGEGSLQLLAIAARYPSVQNANQLSNTLGLITAINDYPDDQTIFAQLSYTQALPGNSVLLTLGQFPFFNFDSNQYLFNQQINFNSTIFSQNGSATYANAGLGAYGQFNLSADLQLAGGLQDARNWAAGTLSGQGFGQGGFAWFGYGQWTPKIQGWGSAQVSLLYYQVPTIPSQSASRGWSVNAVQNLNAHWALFARANQADGALTPIRGSYAFGAAWTNPLGRSATDQIGLAIGRSLASPPPANPAGARDETVLEAYWSWTFLGGLLLTPSVQVVLDPALEPERSSAWALTLRATLML